MSKTNPFISIIIPVKNDAGILGRCLESLNNLDYPKDCLEIIIADGLSTDNTVEVAKSYVAKVVSNERQIVVSGRNRGFEQAHGNLIAFTDADCIFSPDWLKNSIKYFNDDRVAGVGGLTLVPQNSSRFEEAINFIFYLAGIFSSTVHLQKASSAREVIDIPGCNAIYRKDILAKVMPIDENILTAEDVWMNFRVRALGYKLILAPDIILWHYRRCSPKRFIRQVYRFAIGRLEVGKKNSKLLNPFHIFVGLSLPIILAIGICLYLLGFFGLFLKLLFIFFGGVILFSLVKTKSLAVAMNTSLAITIFIIAWSAGFLKELIFPLRDVRGK